MTGFFIYIDLIFLYISTFLFGNQHQPFRTKISVVQTKKKRKKFKRKKRKRGDAAPGAVATGEAKTVKRLRQLEAHELVAMQLRQGISAATAVSFFPCYHMTEYSTNLIIYM